jgi:hypothetical protein
MRQLNEAEAREQLNVSARRAANNNRADHPEKARKTRMRIKSGPMLRPTNRAASLPSSTWLRLTGAAVVRVIGFMSTSPAKRRCLRYSVEHQARDGRRCKKHPGAWETGVQLTCRPRLVFGANPAASP